jgi:hypothetical protein
MGVEAESADIMGVKGRNISYKYRAWFMVYDS